MIVRSASRSRSVVAVLAVGLLQGLPAAMLIVSMQVSAAHAQVAAEDEELQEQKAYWQQRYRQLRQEAARLERNAERARKAYALAQRRNYPRGGARELLFKQIEDAETELKSVQAEIAALPTEARRAGAMPGWFYEVEEEEVVIPEPASPDSIDSEEEAGREGRNPLYLDDEDAEDDS